MDAIPQAAAPDLVLPNRDIVSIDIPRSENGEGAKLSFEECITHGRAIRIERQKPVPVDPSMDPIGVG